MANWYSRPNTVEMADGTEKTEYHLCFETFDKDEAKHIEGVFKAVMDGKDINIPDTNVGDTISRQATIDAIVGCTNCETADKLRAYVTKHNLDNGWTGGIADALDAVEDLPPAQPEQDKMIKEIRKWINSGNRGSADYFIVDKIEEIINKYE